MLRTNACSSQPSLCEHESNFARKCNVTFLWEEYGTNNVFKTFPALSSFPFYSSMYHYQSASWFISRFYNIAFTFSSINTCRLHISVRIKYNLALKSHLETITVFYSVCKYFGLNCLSKMFFQEIFSTTLYNIAFNET